MNQDRSKFLHNQAVICAQDLGISRNMLELLDDQGSDAKPIIEAVKYARQVLITFNQTSSVDSHLIKNSIFELEKANLALNYLNDVDVSLKYALSDSFYRVSKTLKNIHILLFDSPVNPSNVDDLRHFELVRFNEKAGKMINDLFKLTRESLLDDSSFINSKTEYVILALHDLKTALLSVSPQNMIYKGLSINDQERQFMALSSNNPLTMIDFLKNTHAGLLDIRAFEAKLTRFQNDGETTADVLTNLEHEIAKQRLKISRLNDGNGFLLRNLDVGLQHIIDVYDFILNKKHKLTDKDLIVELDNALLEVTLVFRKEKDTHDSSAQEFKETYDILERAKLKAEPALAENEQGRNIKAIFDCISYHAARLIEFLDQREQDKKKQEAHTQRD